MGSSALGGYKQGQVPLQTSQQSQFMNQLLNSIGPEAVQYFSGQFTQPTGGEYMDVFQQSVVDPSLLAYRQQVLPAIEARYERANAGSSSALNQALAQSASDLTTLLGGQLGQFYESEAGRQQANRTNALNALLSAMGQQTFQPYVQQQQGWLGPALSAAGSIGAAFL